MWEVSNLVTENVTIQVRRERGTSRCEWIFWWLSFWKRKFIYFNKNFGGCWEKQNYFISQYSEHTRSLRKSVQELKAGIWRKKTDAKTMDECSLLACWFLACSICIFIKHRTTSPGVTPPTIGWMLSNQLSVKTLPYRLSTSKYYRGIFSIVNSSFW